MFIDKNYFLLFFLIIGCSLTLTAQEKFTISGYIKDLNTGETLVEANVYNQANLSEGTTSNIYGFYSLSLPEGEYNIAFSYLGYADKKINITLDKNMELNVQMESGLTVSEVVVTAEEADNVDGTQMGTIDLPVENIKLLPALLGEVDILKALQLLPGVLSSGEGNAGFYVRGGGPDQNLILLDEAVVYNSGHMLGFFSVFNADAVKNTTLIKGNMPAAYGGRVSSVVDIQMKDGNNKNYNVEGGIGLIASRLTIQGPIQKEKSSFMVSGRRTYAFELAQPFLNQTDFKGTIYYFYDFNAKANYRFSQKDRIYLSAYFGRDVLKYNVVARGFSFRMPYGNATATLRWNHLFSEKLFMNLTVIYNDYDFSFTGKQGDFNINVFSGVRDYNGKIDFDYFPTPKHKIKFGVNYTYHRLTPNIARATSGSVNFNSGIEAKYTSEAAIYFQDDWAMNDKISLQAGFRLSSFTHLGPYESEEGSVFKRGEEVKTFWGLEPRFSGKYSLSNGASLKAGVSVNYQYLHLVSNSSSTLPIDVWVPSSPTVKPQIGIQYAAGYFQNFDNDMYESSIEFYFKDLQNQIDYRENYVNNVNVELENEFVFGKGKAYGMELFFKKRKGDLNGWIGYTLARTDRTFPEIKNGETYPAKYDRTHDLSVVVNYHLNKKWDFGAVFVYGTGNTYTPIKSLYFVEESIVPEYGPRNSARVLAYHRLDLSATLDPNPEKTGKFKSTWTFAFYNVYNRQNAFYLFPDLDTEFIEQGQISAKLFKISLFPIMPSVTWNFKWK